MKSIAFITLVSVFLLGQLCDAQLAEPGKTDKPAWAGAVVKALCSWKMEIIQCDCQPTVTVGQHNGYRLFLQQGHKVYDSPKTQVAAPPQSENKFVVEYSYIDLVLLPSEKVLPASLKDNIPWRDVDQ